MRISVLGSGSKGNCTYIETIDNRILIDAGFSGKKIAERLKKLNIDPSTITCILITHEHGDHIQGAGIFSRKYNIPIYIMEKSYKACEKKLGKVMFDNLNFLHGSFYISQFTYIIPFEVMHDAVITMGFSIVDSFGKKITIATDIGYSTNIVKEHFKNSEVIVIESNYDYNMLMQGPYPWDLKERVKKKTGHHSNESAAKFINAVYTNKLRKVYLAHISKDNNTRDIAYNKTHDYLKENNIILNIEVCRQDVETKLFEI